MSAGEFVVVQVYSDHATWQDYSRCTAAEAQRFMASRTGKSVNRAKHWITGDLLSERQLTVMATLSPSQWADRPPTDADHWTVEVEWATAGGEARYQERFVAAWTGPAWQDLVNDLARESAETGDRVESLKLR